MFSETMATVYADDCYDFSFSYPMLTLLMLNVRVAKARRGIEPCET